MGENLDTPEQLLKDWRARQEYEEAVADVQQGLVDMQAGKGKPAEEAFADIRGKLGFAE